MGKDHFITVTAEYDNLFVSAADEAMVDAIRECLDTGAEFAFSPDPTNESAPIAFNETLLQLLNSLTEPIVPVELQPRCVDMTSRDEVFEMLDAFPPAAVNVSRITERQLRRLLNQLPPATMFAPVLLRDAANAAFPMGIFLMYFIS
ncbi:hypothetical protein B0H17DRAFT_1128893 [Mycena rosella]|uniref:Uncharacterized protein n=1 Tax=Mycena rosella TaxID=1033263 RepID=A0AAD7DXE0_MYCRO|nr:hypothetical protein B0H17DRAFT_1128893 [Mycena rosella]